MQYQLKEVNSLLIMERESIRILLLFGNQETDFIDLLFKLLSVHLGLRVIFNHLKVIINIGPVAAVSLNLKFQ